MAEKNTAYKSALLRELYFNDTLSASELSKNTNLSLPVATKMLNELIENETVLTTGYAISKGGRRPLMYSIAPDRMYILAVAVDQLMTRMVLMNMKNQRVSEQEQIDLTLAENEAALGQLGVRIAGHIANSGLDRKKIIGIGIGMPGFIDSEKGLNYSFLGHGGSSITEYINDLTGIPVFIDNDSSLIALTELSFGVAKNCKTAMVVNLGWGIGLGMILNGKLFKGHNGFAGEFSHIPLFLNNKICSCGKSGCLETECSLSVLVQKAAEGLENGQPSLIKDFSPDSLQTAAEAVLDAAMKGDNFAIGLISEAGYHIGRGIAILIHLMNPETIVLSGMGAAAGKVWQAPVQQALNEHCIPRLSMSINVQMSSLGTGAELIGAAALVMTNLEHFDFGPERKLVATTIESSN